jgi:hypothetical protein
VVNAFYGFIALFFSELGIDWRRRHGKVRAFRAIFNVEIQDKPIILWK